MPDTRPVHHTDVLHISDVPEEYLVHGHATILRVEKKSEGRLRYARINDHGHLVLYDPDTVYVPIGWDVTGYKGP